MIYGLQRLFYGPLRQIEIEQLTEKAWYAVLDTILAMPSLSHDVSGWMLAIFVLLLAGKVWGWIGEGRVDILEQQPPQNPRTFHARLSSSLFLSILFDSLMFRYCVTTVRDDPRPGMMVIFTFEFAILTIFSLSTFVRYALALIEAQILRKQTEQKIEERKTEIRAERERMQREQAEAVATGQDATLTQPRLPSEDDVDENEIDVPGWEEKRRFLFGLELATDFVKLVIYTVFFAISLTFMTLPMHIMRDVYLTFTAFVKRIQDYRNYLKATQNMNDRYPDATAEELSNDNTCIVCREIMEPWIQPGATEANAPRPARMNQGLRAKKLPCGHILHLRCLKAWLERQQSCPTCRRPVISGPPTNANAELPGQARIEGANAGAQPAAAGGNAQPPGNNAGQAPGQPPPRANRLRMLNLGPIRIGVYNGPAHQVQEALAQRRHAQAQQAAERAAGGANGASTAALGTQSTQIQLMQVEERLLREARTLAIEQTQLHTVRTLEAELARLRAMHDRAQQTGPMSQQPPNTVLPQMAAPGMMGMPVMQGPSDYTVRALPQAFQAAPGQTPLVAGDPALPQGMALPAGWTVTPLHRIGGLPLQGHPSGTMPPAPFPSSVATFVAPGVAPPGVQSRAPTPISVPTPGSLAARSTPLPPLSGVQTGPRVRQSGIPGYNITPTQSAAATTSTSNRVMQPWPPVDLTLPGDSGSDNTASVPSETGTTTEEAPAASSNVGQVETPVASSSSVPAESGWGFNDIDNASGQAESVPESSDVHESVSDANAAAEPPSGEDKGKGKAKAVVVEDEQDAEE